MRWLLASALALAALGAPGHDAWARSEKTLAYPRDQAWPAAVRFLAVDERLRLVDKDEGAGYVLFELRDEGKVFRGSLEVIAVIVDGRPLVRFVLAIEDRPSWLEASMLGRLERKLRAELGSPVPAPATRPKTGPKPPPAPADDGGPPISTSP